LTATSIGTILIANRGEIAARVARTCRALGIRSVAVFTEADADALHVRVADAAIRITDYLDGSEHLRAAADTGADAIHPGFGFLAEDAPFARSVTKAGRVFIGPSPEAISAMGSKAAARVRMASSGVPVLPGYDGEFQSDEALARAAEAVGFPLLVKPAFGGGGKGMAVVEDAASLPAALASARRLAKAAFGDDRLVLERYLQPARHVEVQIIADTHGTCLHLWERECSIQRRHQKVIEEAPSPAFAQRPADRARMLDDACAAARSVGYVNAGTVEFIVDAAGRHYFLEMNTRLQVEHPVTEEITGLDLVELQIRVAEGRPLGIETPPVSGWAIEARLYAEDPDNGYLPSTGVATGLRLPELPGLRIDAGIEAGSAVGIDYDPMLAKVIAHGPDRETARRRLVAGLRGLRVAGLRTNRDWLLRVVGSAPFRQAALHTGFLAEHAFPPPGIALEAGIAAVLFDLPRPSVLPGVRRGWRGNPWPAPAILLEIDGQKDSDGAAIALFVRETGSDRYEIGQRRWRPGEAPEGVPDEDTDGLLLADPAVVRVVSRADLEGGGARLCLEIDGRVGWFAITPVARGAPAGRGTPNDLWVDHDGRSSHVRLLPDFTPPGTQGESGGCVAPMPGRVVRLEVSVGDAVTAGQALVVLEAMKMEHVTHAPADGVVAAIPVRPGEQVERGTVLVVLDSAG